MPRKRNVICFGRACQEGVHLPIFDRKHVETILKRTILQIFCFYILIIMLEEKNGKSNVMSG